MKKIISFLLASAMAASMGVTAFAKTDQDDVKELHVFAAIVNRDENRAFIGITDDYDYMENLKKGDIPGALEAMKMDGGKLNDLKIKAKFTEGKQYVGYTGFSELHGLQFVVLAYGNDMNIDKKQHINLDLSITNKNGKEILEETTFRIKMDDTKDVIDEKELGTPDPKGRVYGEWNQAGKEAAVDLDALNANKEMVEDLTQRQLAGLGKHLVSGKITQQGKIAEYETLNSIPYNFMRVVDFDKAEEIELESDMFSYSVSASKQGKVALSYNNKAIPKVEALFPDDADLYFFSFPGRPEFDFTGKATITLPDTEKEWVLYQINPMDGTMAPVANAVLNEDGDALEFKTRILGTYVMSDTEPQMPKSEGEAAAAETEAVKEAAKAEGETAPAETKAEGKAAQPAANETTAVKAEAAAQKN